MAKLVDPPIMAVKTALKGISHLRFSSPESVPVRGIPEFDPAGRLSPKSAPFIVNNQVQAGYFHVKFLAQAVYDTLPSLANLHVWGKCKISLGLLHTASDWLFKVDLGKQLKFPLHNATSSLRPGMIINSEATKQLMQEFIVPWEEWMDEANEQKLAKNQDLVETCQGKGCEYIKEG